MSLLLKIYVQKLNAYKYICNVNFFFVILQVIFHAKGYSEIIYNAIL